MAFTPAAAETLALRVLDWLLGEEALLPVFLGSTGTTQADLRSGTDDPVFLGSVLDFVLMDDAWVVRACDALAIPYESLAAARMALPGGEQVHWT